MPTYDVAKFSKNNKTITSRKVWSVRREWGDVFGGMGH